MSLADRYFFAMLGAVTVAVAALSCGGSQLDKWTDADTAAAEAQRNASIQLESVCARDGGPCPGGAVRSIEGSMCLNASAMLYRHVAGYPADAGCRP